MIRGSIVARFTGVTRASLLELRWRVDGDAQSGSPICPGSASGAPPEAARRRPDVPPDTNKSTRADRALGRIVAEIPAQQKLFREYAHAQQFAILHEFIDVETAKQAGRGGFGEMLSS